MHLDPMSEIMSNHLKRKEALDAFKQTRDEFIKPLLDKLVCLELRYSISSPMGKLIHALELHKDDENNPLRLISKFYNINFDSDFPKIKRIVIVNILKKDLLVFLDIIKSEQKDCANSISIITDIINEEDKYFYHIKDDRKIKR